MLRVDRYTQFVLTVIAACLLWLCLRGTSSVAPVYGQAAANANQVQDVRIVGISKPQSQSDKEWGPVNVWTVNPPR